MNVSSQTWYLITLVKSSDFAVVPIEEQAVGTSQLQEVLLSTASVHFRMALSTDLR